MEQEQEEEEKGKWFDLKFRKGKAKVKEGAEQGKLVLFVNAVLGTKEQKINFMYSCIIVGCIIGTFFAYYGKLITNITAFIISTFLLCLRVIAFTAEKLTSEQWDIATTEKIDPKMAKILFATEYIIFSWGFVMMFNLMYDFRMWTFLTDRWIIEIAISINSIFVGMIVLGAILVYAHRDDFKKQKEKGQLSFGIWYIFFFIITPAVLIATLIPTFIAIDQELYGGAVSSATYSDDTRVHYYGQAVDDWFAYTFFIFFQAPLPAFMIAIMGFGAIAVILAQNQAQVGRTTAGVAVGIIALIPMLIVISAMTGSIPPPSKLMEVIGLGYGVAAFVYGMGLILTYTIAISVMGVFISSSRVLTSAWA